ncbi:hypothetical protein [Amycolatopsis rubida]|uniref:Serine/threonine protein phosphatase PrpC n=1 Tax=Amycolatopsis rubida TaxID=112413 RepID=A0A1I5W9G4_9PSEU|nr:hypothetical protein [Amycolatopsis rubida]SFQ15886.1 Serine/threonine protein phosphatase PrpC [Amycolatopsis rubida]
MTADRGTDLRVVTASVAKQGRDNAENEDFAAMNLAAQRFAVADGASDAARPEVWSRLLAQSYVDGELDATQLDELGDRWHQEVFSADLPWFAIQKLSYGSAATFAGLALSDSAFDGEAVGDCCLFQLREGAIILAFPLDDPARFTNFPDVLRTHPPAGRDLDPVHRQHGSWRTGDLFVLASDALAKYLLERPDPARPLEHLLASPDSFAELVAEFRADGLANDDTTICVVRP